MLRPLVLVILSAESHALLQYLLKDSNFKYNKHHPVEAASDDPERMAQFGILLKGGFAGERPEQEQTAGRQEQTPPAERSKLLVRFPFLGNDTTSPRSDPPAPPLPSENDTASPRSNSTLDETKPESWSLPEYGAIPDDLIESGMSVHQALFVAFNEG
jgi:hypothetical protein